MMLSKGKLFPFISGDNAQIGHTSSLKFVNYEFLNLHIIAICFQPC
jgi:hypothetical protein